MKNYYLTLIFWGFAFSISAQDKKDCLTVEPTYISRMPGFHLVSCKFSEFDTYKFSYIDLNNKTTYKSVNGTQRELRYEKDANEPRKFSGLQIRTNYENAVIKAKGVSLSVRKDFFRMKQDDKEVFFKIDDAEDSDDRGFVATFVEVAIMKQDVTASMSKEIDLNGKIALYGIVFDVGKSEIKPESAEAIKQITDYLNANPAVKVYIVGHTDNTGTLVNNLALSKARAESIKKYLTTTAKIDANRLLSDGVASLCPLGNNSTEDGRKLNRRVEIVKQ